VRYIFGAIPIFMIFIYYSMYNVSVFSCRCSRLIVGENVRQVSNIGRFIRVHVHEAHSLQVKGTGGQSKEFDLGRVAGSRQERTTLYVSFQGSFLSIVESGD
jgi:hypothetical protein